MSLLDEIETAIPALRRYAHALMRDRDAADDLVHDCLERALARRHLWRGDGPVRAWMFRILLNLHRDGLRRKPQRHLVAVDSLTKEPAGPARQEAHTARDRTKGGPGMSETQPIRDEDLIAFRSGVLDDHLRKAMAARIAADPWAQATLAEWDRQDAALSALYGPVAEEPLPEALRARLDAAAGPSVQHHPIRILAAALALLAIGAGAGWFAAGARMSTAPAFSVADGALRAHVTYVTEVAHPVEVAADEADHLVHWLSKRLGHQIKAPDFAAEGFRLMGGRLLPGDTSPAALFMYEDDAGHRLTLYALPEGGAENSAFQFLSSGKTQGFYWHDAGLSYAVIGDLDRDRLRAIALAAYDQLI
jgi:anti-sigma factor RsiW